MALELTFKSGCMIIFRQIIIFGVTNDDQIFLEDKSIVVVPRVYFSGADDVNNFFTSKGLYPV